MLYSDRLRNVSWICIFFKRSNVLKKPLENCLFYIIDSNPMNYLKIMHIQSTLSNTNVWILLLFTVSQGLVWFLWFYFMKVALIFVLIIILCHHHFIEAIRYSRLKKTQPLVSYCLHMKSSDLKRLPCFLAMSFYFNQGSMDSAINQVFLSVQGGD